MNVVLIIFIMMMKESFFSKRNTVRDVNETDELQLSNYLEAIEAFARTTYESIYIIDYQTQGFEFVSQNPLFLCGYTAEVVTKMGYEFYSKTVPPEDLALLLKINTVGFDFYEKIPIHNRKEYSISYDFHIQNQEGKQILINQKLTPIFLNHKGKIWKALCIVSLSKSQSAGNITIYRSGKDEAYHYDLQRKYWRSIEKVKFSDREIEILQLSIRGYTISEISKKIFISNDTVKFHRKKIFEKLNVSNINEAIVKVTENKLI